MQKKIVKRKWINVHVLTKFNDFPSRAYLINIREKSDKR